MNRSTPKERNIGRKVAQYRGEKGLSQKELAARLQTLVWKVEKGRRALSIFEIDKITEVLGVDYNALFAREDGE